ncbi:AAEL012022-PA [Aedes aegypti]|uniref:AAEL012022-PA n=1 Tax=Aedes aegypti TaxID=7159 RepID=Q16NC3_AEDAE|nr:AAEL012022-PA [Aedes aegypti]
MKISEQVFERYINEVSGAQVSCVVRHTREDLLVQYATPEDRHKAIQTCQIGVPGLIFIYQAKQRFLEQNVEMELVKWIQSNPKFMDMLPPSHVLQALFNGRIPDVDQRWITADTLPPSKKLKIEGRKEYRRILNRRICGQARNLFGVFCEFEHFVSDEVHVARIQRKLLKKKEKRAKRNQMNKNGSERSN